MNPRQFDLKAKQECDMMCKQKAIILFSSHPLFKAVLAEDYYIFDDTVEFKVDVILLDRVTGQHVANVEVERKMLWKDRFPFKDIQFLSRKMEKWTNKFYTFGKPTHWMLFSEDYSEHLVVFDEDIKCCNETRIIETVRGKDRLFVIPLDRAHFNYLDEETH